MPEIHWNTDLYQQQHHFVSDFGADVLQWLAPQQHERIVDIGCGTGELTAQIHATGAEVMGLDSSADMINTAQVRFPELSFLQQDASRLNFNETFDAVFSNATFHWIENQEALLGGIYNALKPGGRLVAEFGGKGNVATIVKAIEHAATALNLEHQLITNFWFFPSIGHYATLLEAAGFEVKHLWHFDRPTPLVGEEGMYLWISQFASHAFRHLSPEDGERVKQLSVELLKPELYCEGQWIADYKRIRIKAIK